MPVFGIQMAFYRKDHKTYNRMHNPHSINFNRKKYIVDFKTS